MVYYPFLFYAAQLVVSRCSHTTSHIFMYRRSFSWPKTNKQNSKLGQIIELFPPSRYSTSLAMRSCDFHMDSYGWLSASGFYFSRRGCGHGSPDEAAIPNEIYIIEVTIDLVNIITCLSQKILPKIHPSLLPRRASWGSGASATRVRTTGAASRWPSWWPPRTHHPASATTPTANWWSKRTATSVVSIRTGIKSLGN